jgi:hypothetical protein
MPTNREMFRKGLTPCEWSPEHNRPSLLSDTFHASATVAIGQTSKLKAPEDRRLRVCESCSHTEAAMDAAATAGLRVVRRPLRKTPEGASGRMRSDSLDLE